MLARPSPRLHGQTILVLTRTQPILKCAYGCRYETLNDITPSQKKWMSTVLRRNAHVARKPNIRLHPAWLGQPKRYASFTDLDQAKGDRERIVVLGSGWAGYPLSSGLDHKKYQVIIVSPRSYFVFTPLLASTSVGTLEFRTALEPIRTRRHKTAYVQGWADHVNFQDKTITIEDAIFDPRQSIAPISSRFEGQDTAAVHQDLKEKSQKGELFTLKYDKLIISVGAYSQTFDTPGVKEYANFLKDVGDSRKIRKRILECFETASLPTVPDDVRRQLLSFAVVGGGPTGMEFSAELHDFVREDLSKMYPGLAKLTSLTVYDVADKVLPAFDEKLAKYAMATFKREGIEIKTGRKPKSLSKGLPGNPNTTHSTRLGLTLSIEGHGDVGIGMCVWSTGLMMNPFIKNALSAERSFPASEVVFKGETTTAEKGNWMICQDGKTGSIITNDRLRVMLKAPEDQQQRSLPAAHLKDVFALGDCAIIQDTQYPATAQVASQKADWLAKRLNKGDLQQQRFVFRNLGIMAYLGNYRAIVQGGSGLGNISGRTAWLIWRGAYLVKSLSWRNRILIPTYWFINWLFGRDTSRF